MEPNRSRNRLAVVGEAVTKPPAPTPPGYHAMLEARVFEKGANVPEKTVRLIIEDDGACMSQFGREDAEKLARFILDEFQIDLTPEEPAQITPREPAPEVDAW